MFTLYYSVYHTDSLHETAPRGRSHAGVLTLQAIKQHFFPGTIHLCPEEVEIVGYITGSTTRQNQPGKLQKQHPSPSAALFVTFLQHSALLSAVLLLFTLETTQKRSNNCTVWFPMFFVLWYQSNCYVASVFDYVGTIWLFSTPIPKG